MIHLPDPSRGEIRQFIQRVCVKDVIDIVAGSLD